MPNKIHLNSYCNNLNTNTIRSHLSNNISCQCDIITTSTSWVIYLFKEYLFILFILSQNILSWNYFVLEIYCPGKFCLLSFVGECVCWVYFVRECLVQEHYKPIG